MMRQRHYARHLLLRHSHYAPLAATPATRLLLTPTRERKRDAVIMPADR